MSCVVLCCLATSEHQPRHPAARQLSVRYWTQRAGGTVAAAVRVNQNPRYCPLLNCCTILESSDIEYSIYEKKQNATVVLAPFNKTHFHFYIR